MECGIILLGALCSVEGLATSLLCWASPAFDTGSSPFLLIIYNYVIFGKLY